MNMVAQLFTLDDVLLDVEVADVPGLFQMVAAHWQQRYGVAADEIVKCLELRESLGSTGLGQGVAIPHARIKNLKAPLAAFVRPSAAIDFNSPDALPVNCCFALLVPAKATEQHLKILAEVAEFFSNTEFRADLLSAESKEEIYRLWAQPTDA